MRFGHVFLKLKLSRRTSSLSSSSSSHVFRSFGPRFFSQSHTELERPSFGIVFDIDGVVLRGNAPIPGAPQALTKLHHHSGHLKIPFVFLTNGGGVPDSKRAMGLSRLLGVNISSQQVVQGHSPFKELSNRFGNQFIIAVGKGESTSVMLEYGFKNVMSMDEYVSFFEGIDPLATLKTWKVEGTFSSNETEAPKHLHTGVDVHAERVQAAFVLSDPIDWGRDIQVLCDILKSGGMPGKGDGHQPPLFFANDDLEYKSVFPSNRLGMGAFRIALESIFNRIHHTPLQYTPVGKPNPSIFRIAEKRLCHLPLLSPSREDHLINGGYGEQPFRTIYMVGDNPSVDINGARQAGPPWFSILTRTGVFKGVENDVKFPADQVVNTVGDAVDFILEREAALHP